MKVSKLHIVNNKSSDCLKPTLQSLPDSNLANSSSIYMHDSPDDSLFELPDRAHSSGCIRVGASEHFAHWLLSGDKPGEFTLQDVVARMTAGNITHVSLNRDVPVHTVYFNAWPSHDGELVIMPDIYEQNAMLTSLEHEFHTVFEDRLFESFENFEEIKKYIVSDHNCF